jgi:hypothetical protein
VDTFEDVCEEMDGILCERRKNVLFVKMMKTPCELVGDGK